jgi:hypothetical protein
MQKTIKALQAENYLTVQEIKDHLKGVEYIIMAAPTTRDNPNTPIHFTIFLNTQDELPTDIQHAILDKFADQYKITNIYDVFSQLDAVAFAETNLDSIMPMHLFKDETKEELEHTMMHIIDFEADAEGFGEVKAGSTGWSYSYDN